MAENKVLQLKNNVIEIGKILWGKDLASALNGNISARVDDKNIVLTATKTCLGDLLPEDIITLDLQGNVLEEGKASTEKLMHTEIYKNFPNINAIVHTHTPYINGYFLANRKFSPEIFEAKLWFGDIEAIEQNTAAVTDTKPIIESLKKNNITVLRKHGVVAVGENLVDCFFLIQILEEAIKTDSISRIYKSSHVETKPHYNVSTISVTKTEKKYKLFSKEHIDEIVKIVNADSKMQELGKNSQMTMELAVKMDETGQVFRLSFKDGRIQNVFNDENAEFVINAPESVWRSVFRREIDPFVATTQKKMNLKGDFAKISKWYAPCSRIFELWTKVEIE